MDTYRALMADGQFRSLWLSTALTTAATTMSSLALAALVHRETGSALLTALAMFGPSLVQVLGASTLMSAADGSPPRRVLILVGLVTTATAGLQAALPLGPGGRLLLVFGAAYALSIGSGVRWGLLTEIVPPGGFTLARSAMNLAVGAFQIIGYATSGLLLTTLSTQQIFVLATVVSAVAVPVLRLGVAEHRPRRATRVGPAETWRGNRRLLAQRVTRPLLLALIVPNGLVVGCEALFVPYAGGSGGILLAAAAAGMMAGDLTVGRLLDARGRRRAGTFLRLLLAAPFLAFALHPSVPVAAGLAAVAAIGYGAGLAQQEQLVALVPVPLQGQTLGVESSARMTMQGVCAALAGALADRTGPALAVTILAGASLAVSVALTPALTRAAEVCTSPAPRSGAGPGQGRR
ncbi:MFS transporter [Actinoplanes sp. NPDC049548]|uniref:MFS transporter n=1 Tax=Actinoplanes sp. NPDC049548 TaxID=3155152 RepID=UPI003449D018